MLVFLQIHLQKLNHIDVRNIASTLIATSTLIANSIQERRRKINAKVKLAKR